eukprot:TRINITY_DN1131_c0_g2_i2.p1 TRINITY_DN1131_c0_g2~~TRINITY_DN1131_c0_g2_i2.p1  ORF type:complete len:411 (+),score=132.00 TRINITY_DN1131_c0_g2_i2:46-1278(+)
MASDSKASKTGVGQKQELILDHSKMVNEEIFSDVIFTVEKQQVFGHSYICNERAPALMNPKDPKRKPKKKKNTILVEVAPNISHKTFVDVLYYIYRGSLDIAQYPVFQVMLIDIAAKELELQRLHQLCENYLLDIRTSSNIISILKSAHQLSLATVKKFALHYIAEHFNEFSQDKEGVKELGIDLFQEAVAFYQDSKANPLKPLERAVEVPNQIIQDFKKIYEDMLQSDVTFRIGKEFIQCHKGILAAQTSELSQLCSAPPQPKTKETPECIVIPSVKGPKEGKDLPVISSDAFRAMLRFVYYSECNIHPLHACELIPFARDYSLNELQYTCIEIVKKNITKETALQIIGLTYLAQMAELEVTNKELKQNSVDFVLNHLQDIDIKSLRFMNPQVSYDLLIAHQEREKRLL